MDAGDQGRVFPANPANAFSARKVCLILPTYNNAQTLGRVIRESAAYTKDILVINDGSTDNTDQVLKEFPFLQIISGGRNRGKGWAIRQGFAHALASGFDFAITIDSDGQHYPEDLPRFLEKLAETGPALIVGARNMDQASVPGKSNFGHRFSNFWYRVETGISLPDTQSGYRLYPIRALSGMRFFTRKYEFEIEVIVRAAWKGIKVESVPVRVYYPPPGERVSHFRPFMDFTRISLLNTLLVTITFLYIKPAAFFRRIFQKKKGPEILRELLYDPGQSDLLIAASVGFGVFMGIMPIWGFQLLAAISMAFLLRLNKALVILAANISIPPFIPLIIFGSLRLGSWWMPASAQSPSFHWELGLDAIKYNLQQYIYGSITLALMAGSFFLLSTFLLLKIFRRKTPVAI